MGFFSNLWNGIKNVASNVWNGVKHTASTVWNAVKKPISYIPLVGDKIVNGVETVGNAISKGAEGIGHLAAGRVGDAINAGRDAYNGVKEGVNKLTNLKKGGKVPPHAAHHAAHHAPVQSSPAGAASLVGGTRPYVMHDGIPSAVTFQR